MAGIDGINNKGNNNIDWQVLLNSITGGQGVGETQKGGQRANLVMSESEKQVLQELLSAPEIDIPASAAGNPAVVLDSLIGKLQDGKTFQYTDEQLKSFNNTLETLQKKLASSGTTTPAAAGKQGTAFSTNTSKVLFDIYKMLALLAECAQQMKNAQREQRQAESAAIQAAIQNQADMQRDAALTGLIAGGIVCLIQVSVTAYSAYKTVSNTKSEVALSNEYHISDAATEIGTAQAEADTAQQALNTFNQEHPVPAENQPQEAADITQQREQLQTRVDEKKAALMDKKFRFESAKQRMKNSTEFNDLQKSQALTKAIYDITQAFGNFGQTMIRGFVDLQQAEASMKSADQKKAEEALEQTKDLMSSFQEVIDQVLKLAQAVQAAESQSMRDAIQA